MTRLIALLAVLTLYISLAAYGDDTPFRPDPGDSAKVEPTAALKLPTMIDLGSKSCIPCKKMAPILEQLQAKYAGRAEIVFIDIRENRKAASQYKITLIPTQIFFDSLGAEIYRHIGFFSGDSIEAHLSALGAKP